MKSSNWFLKYWYFLLLPAFLCAAGTQCTTTLPGAVIGFCCALALVYIAVNMGEGSLDNTNWYTKIFIFVILPIIIVVIAAFLSGSSRIGIFYGADLNNPYLNGTQAFWRAVISGVGGVFATLMGVGAAKLFSSNSTVETKSIDDVRIKGETDSTKPLEDNEQI
jgi:hypothetical protein